MMKRCPHAGPSARAGGDMHYHVIRAGANKNSRNFKNPENSSGGQKLKKLIIKINYL